MRGASTITQQVMKNFLLDGSRSAERKIKEIILAVRIEESMPKERILELYLNEIFLGKNSFGVTAAALTYFNKPLSDLTASEVAYLAVLPKAPSRYDPVRDLDRVIPRRNFVLREMWENGYLDDDTYNSARNETLKTVQSGDFESFRSERPPRDYFTDEIRRQLSQDFGEDEFFNGGLSIRATVDPEMQIEAADALQLSVQNVLHKLQTIAPAPVSHVEHRTTLSFAQLVRACLTCCCCCPRRPLAELETFSKSWWHCNQLRGANHRHEGRGTDRHCDFGQRVPDASDMAPMVRPYNQSQEMLRTVACAASTLFQVNSVCVCN